MRTRFLGAFGVLGCAMLLLGGCADTYRPSDLVEETAPSDLVAPAAEKIEQADSKLEDAPKGPLVDVTPLNEHPGVMVEVNERVRKWLDYFSRKDQRRFRRMLIRGQRHRAMVEEVFARNKIPKELYYLGMIESGYVSHAVSSANAVGIWQLVSGTAHRYGLHCDRTVDERRDPYRATQAAAAYLGDLYNVFGSWRLAAAAYNAGEGRIVSAILRGKSRDFWTLAERKVLPAETMDYLPKLMAAMMIGDAPSKYGFDALPDAEPARAAELVKVPSPIALGAVAQASGIALADLRELNPQLLRGRTPAGVVKYAIWVPRGDKQKVENATLVRQPETGKHLLALADMPRLKRPRALAPKHRTAVAIPAKLHSVMGSGRSLAKHPAVKKVAVQAPATPHRRRHRRS